MTEDGRPPRYSTPAYVLYIAVVVALVSFLYSRHSWLSVVALVAFGTLAQLFRERRRPPEWSEAMDRRFLKSEPKVWAAMGWSVYVMGIIFLVVVPIVVISWAASGNWANAAMNLFFSLPLAIGFVAAGRWLINNRRKPFGSIRKPPDPEPGDA